jgi:glycosyltransferase involved in cell wall biosynthesis
VSLRQALQRVAGRDTPAPPFGFHGADALLELARNGQAPLAAGGPAPDAPIHIATVIPSFRRGSGGHAIIVHLLEELRTRGHRISVHLEDCEGRHAAEPTAVTKRAFRDFFGAEQIELECDFDSCNGADVVLATGWQTVARVLLLNGVRARAYLVQDHEPDFYGASAEALWATQTYRQGLHCIAGSAWLAGVLRNRYGATATHYEMGVNPAVYSPPANVSNEREPGLVIFYARAVTPRRAVPLGLMALAELARRRGNVEIALYGESQPLPVPFAHTNLGVLDTPQLAALYRRATVGLVLSLTNPSLAGIEMMASGLPCVEVASEPMVASFGFDGPLVLAEPDPMALCDALETLLDDPARRAQASADGVQLTATRTWAAAATDVERGLRAALAKAAEYTADR